LFFPGKEFLGVQPSIDGRVTVNVKAAGGKVHDISDLSSGEKEVLYGYLRLKNLAPKNSVLLVDEPELHLNPRLIGELPAFYWNHLGDVGSNQLWLITHSDMLLERALRLSEYAVYHMMPAESSEHENQLMRVTEQSLSRAIIDLVGEKTAYRHNAPLVIFEGGGDSEFDLGMTCDLFPELASVTNPISGSNRVRVVELRRLLERATERGEWRPAVFSVTDRDSLESREHDTAHARELAWDVYHIENYLLNPECVLDALREALREKCPFGTVLEVDVAMREAARVAIQSLLSAQVKQWAHEALYACLKLGCNPDGRKLATELSRSAEASAHKI
jgi:hypothetical protein